MSLPQHPIRRRPDGTIDTDHYVRTGETMRATEINIRFFEMLRAGVKALRFRARLSWVHRKT